LMVLQEKIKGGGELVNLWEVMQTDGDREQRSSAMPNHMCVHPRKKRQDKGASWLSPHAGRGGGF
jgi:hypothetical protein